MKVQHIESGLGNQMLGYLEYLALKRMNPEDKIYIENIIFDIDECNEVICQWNGYELKKIFGLELPNIKECFDSETWKKIISEIRESRFWANGWNYPVVFTEVFRKYGLELDNMGIDFNRNTQLSKKQKVITWLSKKTQNRVGYFLRKSSAKAAAELRGNRNDENAGFMPPSSENQYWMQRLHFKNRGIRIDKIEDSVRKDFKFPELEDKINIQTAEKIKQTNSVAIHARRGDMLSINGECYLYGYFKRAVKYVKRKVHNPEFYFFCDPQSVKWCKENYHIFGLDPQKDHIHFIDWNGGDRSYIDMQLMSLCKHNIITNSSFGWWGAFLNSNPDKITISPYTWLNTTKTIF